MNFLVLLLIALPACLAQFTIQGPSDGNRVAQGLRIEEGKGIEYTDQNDGHDGGFSIQGATDGSAQIQGSSDGHSNFQIQGATQGIAERYVQGPSAGAYNIQGASDGHSQSIIQGAYDGRSGAAPKSLQYNDPSGLRVNWRSYDRQSRPAAQQEYSQAAAPSAPRTSHRQRASAPRQPPPPPEPVALQQSKSIDNAPSHIKHLLQLQAQLPYVNIIPEPYRYENLISLQGGNQPQPRYEPRYEPEPQEELPPEPRRPVHRGKSRGPARHRRQVQPQQQHRKLPQPPAEPQIQYSPNLPPHLQQLLKYQAQTPYVNSIPEQYRFNPDPSAQMQLEQFRSYYQDLIRQQPTSPVVHTVPPAVAPSPVQVSPSSQPSSPHSRRQRRQAPHQSRQQPRPQPIPAEPVPQYSTNIPGHIQSLLKYQAQIPYNIIANQIDYRLDKPYVPQPVQPAGPPQVQYQPSANNHPYQGQTSSGYQSQLSTAYQSSDPAYHQDQGRDVYQGQPSGYSQVYASQPQYPQYTQAQLGYEQADQGVRPVTEKQYNRK